MVERRDASDSLNFEERHWRRLGSRLMSDFRVAAVVARTLSLLGPAPGRILDLGCGVGPFTAYAASKGQNVLGIDTSSHQIDQARHNFPNLAGTTAYFRCCELADLVAADETFDSVVILDVLEHVEDRIAFLCLVREILAPQGRAVVCVPAVPEFFDDRDRASGHYLRYDRAVLAREAADAGFDVTRAFHWNLLGWVHRRLTGGGAEVAEAYGFRYSDGLWPRVVNACLRGYFYAFENVLPMPVGMSLFAVLVPRQESQP